MRFIDRLLGRGPAARTAQTGAGTGDGRAPTTQDLPPPQATYEQRTQAQPAAPIPSPQAGPSPGQPIPVTGPLSPTYTVRSGDTLATIAQRVLGDVKRWRELFALNKDLIGAEPDRVYPGQVLKLPT